MSRPSWIKLLFCVAGIYGLLVIVPQYFMEQTVARDFPPAVTHPEYFYGFLGCATAWQIAFLIIATDPARYRPLIIPSVIEKFSFAGAIAILYMQGRVPLTLCPFAAIDFTLGVLFVAAFTLLGSQAPAPD
jgi:hypothetical protein